jgi:hypothetical protein
MRAYKTRTGIDTAIILLILESGEKGDARTYPVQRGEGQERGECMRQLAEVFVHCVCLKFIG